MDTFVDDKVTVEVAPVVLGPETNVVVGIVVFVDGGGVETVLVVPFDDCIPVTMVVVEVIDIELVVVTMLVVPFDDCIPVAIVVVGVIDVDTFEV